MENKELLTADSASKISTEKAMTIEKICEQINAQAHIGLRSARFFEVDFSSEIIKQILNLGYEISKTKDQFGMEITKISW